MWWFSCPNNRGMTWKCSIFLTLLPFLSQSVFGYTTITPAVVKNHGSCFTRSCNLRMSSIPPGSTIDTEDSSSTPNTTTNDSNKSVSLMVAPEKRGKVNEIDFCMAPSDASLSRSYGSSSSSTINNNEEQPPRKQSLTRALNSVSNRAVRRILLSRSWPSPEALNLSLRQVLSSSSSSSPTTETSSSTDESSNSDSNVKCPVPRPILNIIMNRSNEESSTETPVSKTTRTDEQWVNDQIKAFRESYGELDGYQFADAYLESILSLATSGEESHRVSEVLAGEVYDESYRRVVSVIKSVGAVFETIPDTNPPRMRIASKLLDQDICLSMLDKLAMANEKKNPKKTQPKIKNTNVVEPQKDTTSTEKVEKTSNNNNNNDDEDDALELSYINNESDNKKKPNINQRLKKFMFWAKEKDPVAKDQDDETTTNVPMESETMNTTESINEDNDLQKQIENMNPEDLGGVLLSAEEPTMTRQLNVLSNIVKRALLFGGDQELLVLFETLEADKRTFVQKWYPGTLNEIDLDDYNKEYRPGVQYFNCLVKLLQNCYVDGGVTTLDPPYPLSLSYQNSYERLTALLVELGSGYLKPINTKKNLSVPKTPTEEFGRFAQWEVNFRQNSPDIYAYPDDLVGSWQVRDEISGKTIGKSTVILKPDGEVSVNPPLKGLRWRLDPGPTHLDTCTFQVLGEDGAILQYKGFVDRGARLEARFSKRSFKIRGGVSIQMRDGEISSSSIDRGDMLPLTTQTGVTRFVMSKVFDLES